MENIEALRKVAPRWSMAGDQQLLDTLQSLHQRILTNCTETNNRLCEMVSGLDDASVQLQNVNNRFMALSNSQFIESRVYDDDTDISTTERTNTKVQDQQKPANDCESTHDSLLSSLQVLETFHEAVTILPDSESSCSDDEEASSVVLRPKDLYLGRPLPHIIGSHAWNTTWHAGVIRDKSDSESDSKESREREQYSDSEPEDVPTRPTYTRDEVSTPSSLSDSHTSAGAGPLTPADVARELARRLGATTAAPQPQIPQRESPVQPESGTRKVYRVEKPLTTLVFSDEPPPLPSGSDNEYSEPDDVSEVTSKNTPYSHTHTDHNDDSEPEDIFAELKRKTTENKPYGDAKKVLSVADDLFGRNDFGGFDQKPQPPSMSESTSAKRISTQRSEQDDPDLFAQKPDQHIDTNDNTIGINKPIGGISLFGTNKSNQSIGAAILKRQQRKSSEDDDDRCQTVKQANEDSEQDRGRSTEKDLINDLFAKPEDIKNNTVKSKTIAKKGAVIADVFAKNSKSASKTEEVVKETKKKVDLFNDDIFDDIDDIFTSKVIAKVNLKEPNKKQATKSLLTDDNDLFKEIEVSRDVKESQNSSKKHTKSIFDSDDELFSDKPTVDEPKRKIEGHKTSGSQKKLTIESKTETEVPKMKPIITEDIQSDSRSKSKVKSLFDSSSDSDEDMFTKNTSSNEKQIEINKNTSIDSKNLKAFNKTDIFGDEDDDDDIFFTKKNVKSETPIANDEKAKKSPLFNKTNLFDDQDDKLFASESSSSKSDKTHSEVIQKDDDFDKNKIINSDKGSDIFASKNLEHLDQTTSITEQKKTLDETPKQDVIINAADGYNCETSNDDWETEDKNSEEENNLLNDSPPKLTTDTFESINKNKAKEQSVLTEIASEIINNQDRPEVMNKPNLKEDTEKKYENPADSDNIPKTEDLIKSEGETDNSLYNSLPEKSIKKFDIFSDILEKKDSIDPSSSNKNVTEQKITKIDSVLDIFNDQPPEFEKPKEPKKSKNVNALFDDDSDDESLFFKKNDTLVDDADKPDFSPSTDARLFGLFHDEPPAIDVDFVQKDAKSDVKRKNIKDSLESVENSLNFDARDIFKSNTVNKPILESKNNQKQSTDDLDGKNDIVETKKIGKLKQMNLNINVTTLLPGALPKKAQRSTEQTDGQIVSKSNEELPAKSKYDENIEKVDTKLVKSVSFDEKTDSSILNNKLSKERAKIQVKRRPSTRRARREAVKSSGIDFGEDSTDNSSSIDDHKSKDTFTKNNTLEVANTENHESLMYTPTEPEIITNDVLLDKQSSRIQAADSVIRDNISETTETDMQNASNTDLSKSAITFIEDAVTPTEQNHDQKSIIRAKNDVVTTAITKSIENIADDIQIGSPSRDVKSKLVYILHDEDIFNDNTSEETKIHEKLAESVKNTKITNIIDDDDDLFKTTTTKAESETKGVETLGKVYSQTVTRTETFETTARDSDDDIFKDMAKQITETKLEQQNEQKPREQINTTELPTTNKAKTPLFDDLSDSEEELFGKPKKKTSTNVQTSSNKNVSKQVAKSKSQSLFSSDSEEDLFGSNTKKKEVNRSKTQEVEVKRSKEVKGSLFSDIEDDDLFGTAKKTSEPKHQPRESAKKKLSSKPAELVHDDPLSLLGADD